jgi:NADH-quinone oxidoreductase subunit J
MTLGIVASQPLASLLASLPLPSFPLAQAAASAAGHDTGTMAAPSLPAVLPPPVILTFCIVAGLGTFLLLPRRRNPATAGAATSLGGVLVLFAGLTLGLMLIRYDATSDAGGPGVYFWIFSAIALLGALRVVTHPRPVYSALYFVLTVFATAGLFILLWAEFMAAALVIIYAGAILVTYVFVIMLAASTVQAGLGKMAEYDAVSRDPVIASAVGFALTGVLLFVIFDGSRPVSAPSHTYTYSATKAETGGRRVAVEGEVDAPSAAAARDLLGPELVIDPGKNPEQSASIQALGRYLFKDQAVNLELAGLILTLGMVGAILIARRRVVHTGATVPAPGGFGGAGGEAFTAPATPISDDPYSIPVYGTDNPKQKAYPET